LVINTAIANIAIYNKNDGAMVEAEPLGSSPPVLLSPPPGGSLIPEEEEVPAGLMRTLKVSGSKVTNSAPGPVMAIVQVEVPAFFAVMANPVLILCPFCQVKEDGATVRPLVQVMETVVSSATSTVGAILMEVVVPALIPDTNEA